MTRIKFKDLKGSLCRFLELFFLDGSLYSVLQISGRSLDLPNFLSMFFLFEYDSLTWFFPTYALSGNCFQIESWGNLKADLVWFSSLRHHSSALLHIVSVVFWLFMQAGSSCTRYFHMKEVLFIKLKIKT